jgi:uncharacterized protein (TIGR00730 family)
MKNKSGKKSAERRAAAPRSETKQTSIESAPAAALRRGASKPGIGRGLRRKHLDERLRLLHQREMLIEKELRKLEDNRFYRTCIFGSARIKPETQGYNDVIELARLLASDGIDILTGGGPGLMEAANRGAKQGQAEKRNKSLSFGISIQLDFEPEPNKHLDVKRHHHRFSSRLDDFMRLSKSVVITPGGIGTVLELFFTWQLIQVKHIEMRPLVLMGRTFWTGLIEWMKSQPLGAGLVSPPDFNCVTIVDSPKEAYEIISKHHADFRKKVKEERDSTPA